MGFRVRVVEASGFVDLGTFLPICLYLGFRRLRAWGLGFQTTALHGNVPEPRSQAQLV